MIEAKSESHEEMIARLNKQNAERRLADVTIEREFPAEERLVRRWVAHGLDCAMCLAPMGGRNGYVKVPAGHPAVGKWYGEIDVEVNGGLTFTCRAIGGGAWFGFDTNHCWDYWPRGQLKFTPEEERHRAGRMDFYESSKGSPGCRMWDEEAMAAEIESLARQLAAMT